MSSSYPRFSYSDYEQAIRAPHYGALRGISVETARQFRDCRRVLDIACGQGMFLGALWEISVEALGVDSDPALIQGCQARGLTVVQDDVLHFLQSTEERFDGAYCGHLIEHLPYEAFLDLMEGVERVLEPGGLFLIRWPNPRSLITQQLTFWLDPTHDRFYDGDFVSAVLRHYGFQPIRTHYGTVRPVEVSPAPPESSADSLKPPPRGALRQVIGGPLRWLKTSRWRAHPLTTALVARADASLHRRRLRAMAASVFHLPVEATILSRKNP